MKNKEDFKEWKELYLRVHDINKSDLDTYYSQMVQAAWNKGYCSGLSDHTISHTFLDIDSTKIYNPSKEV
jgi:phosphoribosyl-AMP cyclohydrolase